MALHLSRFTLSTTRIITTPKATQPNIPKSSIFTKNPPNFPKLTSKPQNPISHAAPKSSQEQENATTDDEPTPEAQQQQQQEQVDEMSELGAQIKEAMKERDQNGETKGFVSGVVEEIREIEWPVFDKVLGTTGVVLGVIAGSSVVLLTVNAVLAEISDRVFAGKGIQDFFG